MKEANEDTQEKDTSNALTERQFSVATAVLISGLVITLQAGAELITWSAERWVLSTAYPIEVILQLLIGAGLVFWMKTVLEKN